MQPWGHHALALGQHSLEMLYVNLCLADSDREVLYL